MGSWPDKQVVPFRAGRCHVLQHAGKAFQGTVIAGWTLPACFEGLLWRGWRIRECVVESRTLHWSIDGSLFSTRNIVQWNLSNPDWLVPSTNDLIREISTLQGWKMHCFYRTACIWFLQTCPWYRGFFIMFWLWRVHQERFHCSWNGGSFLKSEKNFQLSHIHVKELI